jgi:hypothetical protein
MNLLIRIKDGVPFEHPILLDNFLSAFPNVDINNLPPEFAWFKRVARPVLGVYEKNQTVSYELVDGVYTDVWRAQPMTEQEKIDLQNTTKAKWAVDPGWTSWIFNEEICRFDPPVPVPSDGQAYRWDEPSVSWVVVPPPTES